MFYLTRVMKTKEQIETASTEELKQWYVNAEKTACFAGGHMKAERNDHYATKYREELEKRGIDVGDITKKGTFNGDGSW